MTSKQTTSKLRKGHVATLTLKQARQVLSTLKCTNYHNATAMGYYTRNAKHPLATIEPYKGRYGTGYKLHHSGWISNQYHCIEYWLQG